VHGGLALEEVPLARPGKWIYLDSENVFSGSTATQAVDILQLAPHPVGSTVRRIIGHVDVWLVMPPGSVPNYKLRIAVHQLGGAAGLDDSTLNGFPDKVPYWTTLGLYTENWDPQARRYWARNAVSFDVDGDRKLTAANTTLRIAFQPTGVPRSDGFWVVTWETRCFVSDPP
jgi:hypothetical protein